MKYEIEVAPFNMRFGLESDSRLNAATEAFHQFSDSARGKVTEIRVRPKPGAEGTGVWVVFTPEYLKEADK